MYGWVGQILRVNLSDGTVKKEALDPVEIKNYIGASLFFFALTSGIGDIQA
jgi:aldehyde:ferredoxin oxidoreductase